MDFRLLGPIEVLENGRPIRLGGEKARAVLALLAINAGHVVSIDRLVDELWGDSPPASALRTLRAYVSRLRRALSGEDRDGRPRLSGAASGYILRVEPGELDTQTFETSTLAGRRLVARGEWAAAAEELAGVLGLWRGAALAGLEAYPLAATEAARLDELRTLAVEDRIEADLALGRHAEVVPELERLIAENPYRERLWGHLMLAMYRSGRQADALAVYHRARSRLVEELGIDPGPELRQLQGAILRQEPSLNLVPVYAGALNNAPAERTSFVGRTRELAHLDRLVATGRMVTLTGVGGAGKTRLAVRAASRLSERYPEGTWWVELAELTDPELVPQHVAAALGISAAESRRRDVADVLAGFLGQRRAVIVLDNCEHLVAAVAELADLLLSRCPNLHLLATSREGLRVGGEVTVPVPPLEIPPPEAELPERYPSVRLFLDRAEAAAPGFAADAAEMRAIAGICRRLEGVPLAIELAAARVTVLGAAEIGQRLADHLDVVSGGPRTALPRHRSLRATLDWSFGLIDADQQVLFRALAPFAGGWTLDAAVAVVAPDAANDQATLDDLSLLVDKSLVETVRSGRSVRYRLLEPIRQYAAERLDEDESGSAALYRRHAAHYLGLAEEADRQLRGRTQGEWLVRMDAEHANLRAALAWSLQAGEVDLGLQLVAALGWYWFMRGHWSEARRWFDRAMALPDGSPLARARAIYKTGAIEIIRVNLTEMPSLVADALETCRREGDENGAAWCIHWLGHAGMYTGADPARARRQLREAMARFEELNDEWAYAWSLRYVGSMDEDPEREISLQRDALRRFRALGDTWSASFSLFGLGIAVVMRDPGDAVPLLEEGRRLASALGDRVMVAHNERALGLAALLREQNRPAESLLEGARRTLSQVGDENCTAICSQYIGVIRLREGRAGEAAAELTEALGGFRSIGRSTGMAISLHWLGVAALANGDAAQAAQLMGAAASARKVAHAPLADDLFRSEFERAERSTRKRLGKAAYDAHRQRGEQMSLEESLSLALD